MSACRIVSKLAEGDCDILFFCALRALLQCPPLLGGFLLFTVRFVNANTTGGRIKGTLPQWQAKICSHVETMENP